MSKTIEINSDHYIDIRNLMISYRMYILHCKYEREGKKDQLLFNTSEDDLIRDVESMVSEISKILTENGGLNEPPPYNHDITISPDYFGLDPENNNEDLDKWDNFKSGYWDKIYEMCDPLMKENIEEWEEENQPEEDE